MEEQTRSAPAGFAFVKMGDFSHTNAHVLDQLQARFPHLDAHVIDVGELHVVGKADLVPVALAVLKEFGLSPFLSGARFRRHIPKSAYFFERARRALLRKLGDRSYAFTFQTQSMFDASLPGIPHFVYTDHTHLENFKYPAWTAGTPLSRNWAQLERSVFHNASRVFTMSENISRSLVEEYGCPREKVACVYAGSNVSAAASEDIDGARFRAKNILFVGIDWKRKGGPVLLEAFHRVRQAHPDATLTIVGCSPDVTQPGVEVVGRIPLLEVARYYRSASIFCLPTLNEPFGLVLLEAFSYGLPIVATRIGAIPEIVEDGKSGYLVSPQGSGELADRLQQLLDSPALCAQFGLQGRRSVGERYSWHETGERIASHINRIAKPSTDRERDAAPPSPGSPLT